MVTLSRLRFVRQRRALTQQQLADKAGVNRVTIARLETGSDDPLPTTVRKLAAALRVDPEDLMEPLGDQAIPGSSTGIAGSALPAPPPVEALTATTSLDALRFLAQVPEMAGLIAEAERELLRFFPDAGLRLDLVVDPEYGEPEQLILGILTALPAAEAVSALLRFDEAWWAPRARMAGGRLIVDLAYE
jgi:transcriptional regulator with XRE-family HTH domain